MAIRETGLATRDGTVRPMLRIGREIGVNGTRAE
eukprot:CAMPEP_0185609378 /NCGR_PEP_ID=MMETSP0436-20130131/9712_1 /TAXON_ID=626734 ORGANISM="Favella taraikaensis, Strain Fe Narragansett Bay" /NCGR_SAMPLE_ID=MMETSP0436 /ASSEMBLY_ACC=CAM_ASM_000390 /LENGTH=33 /DNA_ID= /DNA_START= /DNA_END= /DNA_ORIENTATION=